MLATLTATQFNHIEGGFWILLGLICVVLYKKSPSAFRWLCLYAAAIFITFGLSDLVEAYYGSFLVPGMEWLLLWKTIDVLGLVSIVVWYSILRLKH